MKRLTPFFICLVVVSLALALDYRVDPAGGPDDLGTEVAGAFAAWQDLEPNFEVNETDDASTLFRYGTAERFGPDTLTLTVQRQMPERTVEVLVNPSRRPETPTALLHETGLLLGLSTAETGVLNPAIAEPLALGETEQTELEALATFAKEDIDRSGVVDFYDLIALGRAFGQSGVSLPADLNEDGVVDRADVRLLREAYTFGPPSATPPNEPTEEEPLPEELPEVPDLTTPEEGATEEPTDNPAGGETGGSETGGGETGGSETGGSGGTENQPAAPDNPEADPSSGGDETGGSAGETGGGQP